MTFSKHGVQRNEKPSGLTYADDLAEVALSYRKLGPGVVLMRVSDDGSKRTLIKWKSGGLRASRTILQRLDRDDIDESVVLSVVTGGPLRDGGYLVAVDVDTYKPEIRQALERLKLPRTWTSTTPRGGLHFLFRSPKPIASFVRSDGIEVKATGALLTMPPGKGAYWLVDDDRQVLDPFSVAIADLPASVFESRTRKFDVAMDENFAVYEDLAALCRKVGQLQPGDRRQGLLRIGGKAFSQVRAGLHGEKVVYDELLRASAENGTDTSEAHRVLTYVRSTDKGSMGGASYLVVPLSPRDKDVLRFVYSQQVRRFPNREAHRVPPDVYSVRYVAGALGLPRTSVNRSLEKLVRARLLWTGDTKSMTAGQRPAKTYGVTQRGATYAESLAT